MNMFQAFLAVMKRELQMFVTHRTFMRLAIILPLISFLFFVVVFHDGVARDVPIAVLDEDHSLLSRQLTRMFDATPTANVVYHITDMTEGERMMKEGKIFAIIYIPKDMERDIYRNTQSHLVAYIDGLNITRNGLLYKDLQTVATTFAAGVQLQTLMKQGLSEAEAFNTIMPVSFERHNLFNPFINYGYYLLPAFLPMMLMIFIMLTTVFTIGVELKNGTSNAWFETAKNNPFIALTGKLLPYTIIFYTLYIIMNLLLYKYVGVPLRGNAGMLFYSGLLFILAYQSIGVFIITMLSNLRLSLSIGGGYSVLAFSFSGLTFPFLAMDGPIRMFSYIFPFTYYMEIFIDQGMRGAPTANSAAYLAFLLIFLLLPLLVLPRLHKIATHSKYWGRL